VFAQEAALLPVAEAVAAGAKASTRAISALFVPADTRGLTVAERIDVMAPHPLARLQFEACRVPKAQRLGPAGDGFKLAMRAALDHRAGLVGQLDLPCRVSRRLDIVVCHGKVTHRFEAKARQRFRPPSRQESAACAMPHHRRSDSRRLRRQARKKVHAVGAIC